MADFDPSIALQGKVPAPPSLSDIVAPITSLAQLQYLQANAQKVQADTAGQGLTNQFTTGKLQSLQKYNDLVAGGANPEDALSASGLAGYDPAGANATLGNVQTGMTIKGNRAYAANPTNPLSAAPGGPGLVSTAATAAGTNLTNTVTQAQIYGQIGNVMAADPSPQGRAQAIASARQYNVPESMIQQFSGMSDAQWQLAGQHLQQASMTPEKYLDVSGQAAGNKAAAEANYKPIITEPQQGVTLPPGLANVVAPQAAAAQPATPSLGNMAGAPPLQSAGANRSLFSEPAVGSSAVPAPPATSSPQGATPTAPLPNASAPPPSQGGAGSPGLSNNSRNNPGNIRDGAFAQSQPGYLGASNGFAVFQSPLLGQAAMEKNLASYGRQGINTPLSIASKWAPAGDGSNNPQNYASFVAGRLGIGVNDKIDITNPQQRSALAVAMSQMENGANGTNVSAKLTPGAFSPNPTIPGTAPLSNVPAVAGAAPILPASFAPVQPSQVAAAAPVMPITPAAAPVVGRSAAVAAPPAPQAPASPPVQPTAPTSPVAQNGAPPPTGLAADANQPLGAQSQRLPGGSISMQPGMTIAEQAAQRATGEGIAKAQIDQFTQAKEAYQNASSAQLNLNQLQKSLSDLPSSGMLTPGTGAGDRAEFAKAVNTAVTGSGLPPPFDPKEIAAAEEGQKITGKLGFDMSRALGSREAAQIVHQAIGLNPGIENTPQGAKVVAASINAGLQRQKDFYEFLSQNGNKPDSDIAFNRTHPVAQYVQEAQALAKVPQSAVDLIQQHPDSQTLSSYFDKNFGAGLSRYFTGQ